MGAILESYRSLKDNTLKLTFETQEPTPEQLMNVAQLNQKFGFLAFKKDDYKQDEKDFLKGLESNYEDDKKKSPSKRLRDVLFVWWKQDDKGYSDFENFYTHFMEKYIDNIKSKLE